MSATGLGLIPPTPRPDTPWVIGNRYDSSSWTKSAASSAAVVANTMYAVEFVPVSDVRGGVIGLTAAAFRVTVDGAAGTKGRVAVYTMLPSGYPGALVAQAVQLALDPGANITQDDTAFLASVTDLTPYFSVFWGDGAPTLITATHGDSVGAPAAYGGANTRSWAATVTYTAGVSSFPASFPAGATPSAIAPLVVFRRGS